MHSSRRAAAMDIPTHQSAESAVAGFSEHKRLCLRSARTLSSPRQHTSRVHQGHRARRALTAFVLPVHSLGAGDAPKLGRTRRLILCRLLTLLCEIVVPLPICQHRFQWTPPGLSFQAPEPDGEREMRGVPTAAGGEGGTPSSPRAVFRHQAALVSGRRISFINRSGS